MLCFTCHRGDGGMIGTPQSPLHNLSAPALTHYLLSGDTIKRLLAAASVMRLPKLAYQLFLQAKQPESNVICSK